MLNPGFQLLESLRTVRLVGSDKLRLEPASRIPAEMILRIREEKPALLEALRVRPATCSAECHEIEPGVWIHRPWTGCITCKKEEIRSQREVAVTCWHCQGETRCGCIACWQAGPGECVTCEGTGQVLRWIQ